MDVADAINVMLYASARADGQPGCAVWDLFRAEDADKIRALLQTKFDESHIFTDPIHSQLFYLNAELRRELWEKHKVASWRIYQYPVSPAMLIVAYVTDVLPGPGSVHPRWMCSPGVQSRRLHQDCGGLCQPASATIK